MLDRLSGWQRIGAVITALWIIFVLLHGVDGLLNGRGPFAELVKGRVVTIPGTAASCEPGRRDVAPSDPTGRTFTFEEVVGCASGKYKVGTPDRKMQVAADHYRFKLATFLAAGIALPIFAWLSSYVAIAVIRWVARGFQGKAT